jgi:hypothetical protein
LVWRRRGDGCAWGGVLKKACVFVVKQTNIDSF